MDSWADRLAGQSMRGDSVRLASVLAPAGPRLFWLHGVAGIGKTVLLRQWLEGVRDRSVVFLDAGMDATTAAQIEHSAAGADLLVIDDFHRFTALEGWFFNVFLPRQDERFRAVVASRRPLPQATALDPAWRSLVETMELEPLSVEEARRYLVGRGVDAAEHENVLSFAHGVPLWLGLAADLALEGRLHPDAVKESLAPVIEQLLEEAPRPTFRRALQATALVSSMTETRLARMLAISPEEAAEAFRWLRGQAYTSDGTTGIRIHEAFRDALRSDLCWRDPELANALKDHAYEDVLERILKNTGDVQWRAIAELGYLLSKEDAGIRLLSGAGDLTYYLDAVRSDEIPGLLEVIAKHEGAAAAELAAKWIPHAEVVGMRSPEGPLVGFIVYVTLDASLPAFLREADPFVPMVEEYLRKNAPLREGENAHMARFWMSVADHQGPSKLQGRFLGEMMHQFIFVPRFVIGSVHADPEAWIHRPDRVHEVFGIFEFGGREFAIFGNDWRRRPVEVWMRGMVRAMRSAGPQGRSQGTEFDYDILDQETFDESVRAALRSFGRAERLAANPLLRTRLVATAPGPDDVARLRARFREAVSELPARQASVIEHAFFQAEEKGLAIAAKLGMPFGSYRRVLNDAVEVLVGSLWRRELDR